MKQISLFIAAAALLTIPAATGAAAAELPAYERAGFPVSAVQVQVLGAENVQEASSVTNPATPVQFSVLTPRGKITTAQGQIETTGRAVR